MREGGGCGDDASSSRVAGWKPALPGRGGTPGMARPEAAPPAARRTNGKTVKLMIAARRDSSPHPERRAQRARPPLAPGKQSLRTVHHLAKRFQRFARAEAPRTKDKRQPRSGCRGGVNLAVANVERL